jgi:hypothetical protein
MNKLIKEVHPFHKAKETVQRVSLLNESSDDNPVRRRDITCMEYGAQVARPLPLNTPTSHQKSTGFGGGFRLEMGSRPAISIDSHFFHHLTSSHLVAPPDKFTVHVANDFAIYAAEMLIGPLLRILNAKVEKIRFGKITLKFTAITKVDADGNSDEHSIAEARVDLFITVTRRSATTTAAVDSPISASSSPPVATKEHSHTILVLEFKTPHTLNKDGFATRLLRSGTGLLR